MKPGFKILIGVIFHCTSFRILRDPCATEGDGCDGGVAIFTLHG